MDQVQSTLNMKGIIVPTVTPLLSTGEFDKKANERLTNHLLNGGVHGIFILGTTGEISSLKPSIKKELIQLTCRTVDKRVPVIVGITHTAIDSSLKFAKVAKESGADAVVAAPPFYFFIDQQDLLAYYTSLADKSPLPLMLYNFPKMTKCTIAPETVEKLSQHPNIIGLKDSSGDGVYFEKIIKIKKGNPDFIFLVGPEEITGSAVRAGADGGVNGGANIFPSLYVRLYEAAKSRDYETEEKIQSIVLKICDKIYGCSPKASSYLCGLKESLYFLGICEPHLALPLLSADLKTREIIRQELEPIIFEIKSL